MKQYRIMKYGREITTHYKDLDKLKKLETGCTLMHDGDPEELETFVSFDEALVSFGGKYEVSDFAYFPSNKLLYLYEYVLEAWDEDTWESTIYEVSTLPKKAIISEVTSC